MQKIYNKCKKYTTNAKAYTTNEKHIQQIQKHIQAYPYLCRCRHGTVGLLPLIIAEAKALIRREP